MIALRPRTLATKMVLIVTLGAVAPLALVGFWLTRSAERSGTELLRRQISHAADAIAQEVDRRWALRSGELNLLAANSAAQNMVSGHPSSADSSYLVQLGQSLRSIASFTYRDSDGRARWSFVNATDQSAVRPRFAFAIDLPSRTIPVDLPITVDGRTIGTLLARVTVSSLIAPEAAQTLVPGAALSITDSSDAAVWSASPPEAPDFASLAPPEWERVTRTPKVAPLRITVAARAAPYVEPFTNAARVGVGVLLVVAFIALALSVALTTRATRSLEHLADAASAVAAGDLQRTVHETTDDEISRVARAFNAMTDSLRRTLSELAAQRALAAVGEFAASLSHEVRNSLTAVGVDLQHAKRHLPADAQGTQLVSRALDSVRRLDSTVSGALRVARSGRVTKTRLDLDDVLRRAMRSAEPSFVERGAVLEPLAHEPSLALDGDAAALEQLFLNLLINAAQASPPGGRARVERESAPPYVAVRVVDDGHGIADEMVANVDVGFRSTKSGGTGLGLPIARRIAVAHGGDLTFETAPNAGTMAVVRLPATTVKDPVASA